MVTFSELNVGDMFNTITARFVKLDNYTAIVVMCALPESEPGTIMIIRPEREVVVLYTSSPELRKRLEVRDAVD